MNYHELKKLAAPGPFEVAERSETGVSIRCVEGIAGEGRTSNEARFFVHCANNFDKALDWLKNELKFGGHSDECASRGPAPYYGTPSDNGCNCCRRALTRLIAELEEVI